MQNSVQHPSQTNLEQNKNLSILHLSNIQPLQTLFGPSWVFIGPVRIFSGSVFWPIWTQWLWLKFCCFLKKCFSANWGSFGQPLSPQQPTHLKAITWQFQESWSTRCTMGLKFPIAKAFKGYVGQFGSFGLCKNGEVVEVVSQKRTTSITSLSTRRYMESKANRPGD